ncbi:Suppressor protein stp22 of temperature-sensitive alpha-factor receptor and arginine permease [Aspergillus melleus]|uniref:Suppressor protein stp22 of temperature-sensitive alpha-factor receptor and arginine permease n=1 Tax=Aspergillus melleus TaxID=138277 RepID=A0ACC3BDS6_9EURO|nr:Suppressor protein stp22 of temperature-sensitive alpha-factor receptor and arginine permease [Aspergillus melleus]
MLHVLDDFLQEVILLTSPDHFLVLRPFFTAVRSSQPESWPTGRSQDHCGEPIDDPRDLVTSKLPVNHALCPRTCSVNMAAVPQRTLNWLYSVLIRDHYDSRQTYQDPNRTYYDVANVLAQYPSLFPRTEVYTYETGFSALLLQLSGTLPVTFRGTVYKFPVVLWVPNTYPREPPIVYVSPTKDMAVRVGQHVTLEGRVYHHYLAHWAGAWERSSLVDLVSILREVFAKEPPVQYKQQQQIPQRPQQPQQVQAPPPRPPLPPELGPAAHASPTTPSVPSPQPAAQAPPPPPPKPGQVVSPEQQQPSTPTWQNNTPPTIPPLPPKEQDLRRISVHQHAGVGSPGSGHPQYVPERGGAPEGPASPYHYHPQNQAPMTQPMPAHTQGPTHPPLGNGMTAHPLSQSLPPGARAQQQPPHIPPQQAPPHHATYQQAGAQYQHPLPHPVAAHFSPRAFHQTISVPQPAAQPKKETPDLLTSPFELELPSIAPTGPAPPIPPNPEKDALLQAVSKTLAETLQTNVAQSETAAHSLLSQSQSLHAAVATLQGEISSLNNFNATLQSNSSVLQQSLHRADAVIADAQTRISSSTAPAQSSSDPTPSGLPPIDEVLVAPTVVGKQLYDLVAEERGIQQAIYALQSALVKGVIGVETWSRHTRGLAREAFLKRALIRKIGNGMGLEDHPHP